MREIRHTALPNINCNAFVINERAILLIVRALPSVLFFRQLSLVLGAKRPMKVETALSLVILFSFPFFL